MPIVWQRHPRYAVFIFLVIFTTFYLLNPYNQPAPPFIPSRSPISDHTLSARLTRSEAIYQKTLEHRSALIQKWGPQPKDVAMFPPNVSPWPPYTVWDFFPPSFNCPHELERIGSLGDGGKWVCGLSRVSEKPNCVVYSFGINGESSFEAEVLDSTRHCQIWGYDFSVNSMGPQIPKSQLSRTHFFAYGLGGGDQHGPKDSPKMYKLETLMKMNGHTHIDILKIDIESWEFDTLTTIVQSYLAAEQPLPFGQLQLEIHSWHKQFSEFLTWWEALEKAGLRPFMTEPNLVYQNYNREGTTDLAEYSFINIKGDNIFIKDPPNLESEPNRHVRHGTAA